MFDKVVWMLLHAGVVQLGAMMILVTLAVVLFGPTAVAAAVGGTTLGLSIHVITVYPRVKAMVTDMIG